MKLTAVKKKVEHTEKPALLCVESDIGLKTNKALAIFIEIKEASLTKCAGSAYYSRNGV